MKRATIFAVLCWLLVGNGDTPSADRNLQSTSRARPLMHFVDELALSPDGNYLVYVGSRGRQRQLYLRRMNPPGESRPIAGTDGADDPFLSPDGRWVGFFAEAKLKKVAISGGPPVTLCTAPGSRGASWGTDDSIIFTLGSGAHRGLWRIPAAGGIPKPLTKVETEKGEGTHLWPEILPSGKAVLFTIGLAGKSYDEAQIAVLSLETGERRVVLEGGSDAHYAPTGHIIYFRAGKLWAVPFDLARVQVTGPPAPIVENVSGYPSIGQGLFSFSQIGLLVYVRRDARLAERALVWVNRKGEEWPVTKTRRAYSWPRLSPDGRRLAVAVDYDGIWVYDLEGGKFTQLTSGVDSDDYPLWTPDGKRVTFSSNKTGASNLFWKAADGSGVEERITTSPYTQFPMSWSPDGKVVTVYQLGPTTAGDVWLLSREGDPKYWPLLTTPAIEGVATFSPDGHWISYASNESGRFEVYVQPYPGPGQKVQISTEGGTGPSWARNGRELFFWQVDNMMAVDVTTEPAFGTSKPGVLFEGVYDFAPGQINYDVAPDGQRFMMIKEPPPGPVEEQLRTVPSWFEQLKRHVPPGTR